MGDKHQRSRHF